MEGVDIFDMTPLDASRKGSCSLTSAMGISGGGAE